MARLGTKVTVWKNIEGYEGLYEVNNWGEVRSLYYGKSFESRILKPTKDAKGYLRVSLCKNGTRRNRQVRRLVASMFIPNPKKLPCVNHIDENPSNNKVTNLEWCSYEYNNNYGTHIEL